MMGELPEIPAEALEEFAALQNDFAEFRAHFESDASREEIFQRYAQDNPMYLPVFNGHLLLEEFLNRLLAESVKHPNCLRENFGFADRLSILQSVSPIASSSLIWKLLAKLNALRNAVAHGKNQSAQAQLLREIERLLRESTVRSAIEENQPDWIMAYAFGATTRALDHLLVITRLKNRAHRFWEKLGPLHPLAKEAFALVLSADRLVTHDPLDPKGTRP
jgi:hypothetical protein